MTKPQEIRVNKATPTTTATSSVSRFRRQPLYATTRLRCAVAMMVFALAVLLSALPSLATPTACETAETVCASVTLIPSP